MLGVWCVAARQSKREQRAFGPIWKAFCWGSVASGSESCRQADSMAENKALLPVNVTCLILWFRVALLFRNLCVNSQGRIRTRTQLRHSSTYFSVARRDLSRAFSAFFPTDFLASSSAQFARCCSCAHFLSFASLFLAAR